MQWFATACGFLGCVFVGLLGLVVVWKVWTGEIDLNLLISEKTKDGQLASMGRFQLLIFTFVIAISLLKIIEKNAQFPEIPGGVLTLLGISASTYAVGKGIQHSGDSPDGNGDNGDGTQPKQPPGTPASGAQAVVNVNTGEQGANAGGQNPRPRT